MNRQDPLNLIVSFVNMANRHGQKVQAIRMLMQLTAILGGTLSIANAKYIIEKGEAVEEGLEIPMDNKQRAEDILAFLISIEINCQKIHSNLPNRSATISKSSIGLN